MKVRSLIICLFVICDMAQALASPPTGFHKGPYIMLNGGILNYTVDNNQRTGAKVGRDIEPSIGFNFGWFIKDSIAPELMVRYSTNKNGGSREHVVNVNLNAIYSFIVSPTIIPFAQIGPVAQFAAIPGDPSSSDRTIALWGVGAGAGGGIRLLFLKYGYAGLLAQMDFIKLPSKYQDISGTSQRIIKGGFDVQPALSALAGFHF